MKNILAFGKGSQASHEEMHLIEKIRVLANRYAEGETAQLLIVLAAYTKINGLPKKLSRVLDLSPTDYDKALAADHARLLSDPAFANLFHHIRTRAEDAIAVPRFPAVSPQSS